MGRADSAFGEQVVDAKGDDGSDRSGGANNQRPPDAGSCGEARTGHPIVTEPGRQRGGV